MEFFIIIGVVVFIIIVYCLYWGSRNKMYERISYATGYYITDNESIQNQVAGHGLDLFRKNDGQVKVGIEGKVEDGKIYMADLTLHVTIGGGVEGSVLSELGRSRYSRRYNRESGPSSIVTGMVTSCFVVSESLEHLPSAFICTETLFEKGIALLGGQDIDFDEDPTFSDRFTLQGPSEVNIRDFFKSKLRSEFCKIVPNGVNVEFGEGAFAVYTNKPASYGMSQTLIKVSKQLYEFLKQYSPIYDD